MDIRYNWLGFQAWDTLQDSTDNNSIDKVETSLEWHKYFSPFQDTTDALPCHIHVPVCLWIMDPCSRAPRKNTSHGSEELPQDTMHLIQRPCYQQGSSCQDPAGNRTTWRLPDHGKETQTAVVWSCLLYIRSGQSHLARHSERGKKTRQTEEEVGRQHLGMDRPGVHQVPEGSGEQGKMEETGCVIISNLSLRDRWGDERWDGHPGFFVEDYLSKNFETWHHNNLHWASHSYTSFVDFKQFSASQQHRTHKNKLIHFLGILLYVVPHIVCKCYPEIEKVVNWVGLENNNNCLI